MRHGDLLAPLLEAQEERAHHNDADRCHDEEPDGVARPSAVDNVGRHVVGEICNVGPGIDDRTNDRHLVYDAGKVLCVFVHQIWALLQDARQFSFLNRLNESGEAKDVEEDGGGKNRHVVDGIERREGHVLWRERALHHALFLIHNAQAAHHDQDVHDKKRNECPEQWTRSEVRNGEVKDDSVGAQPQPDFPQAHRPGLRIGPKDEVQEADKWPTNRRPRAIEDPINRFCDVS